MIARFFLLVIFALLTSFAISQNVRLENNVLTYSINESNIFDTLKLPTRSVSLVKFKFDLYSENIIDTLFAKYSLSYDVYYTESETYFSIGCNTSNNLRKIKEIGVFQAIIDDKLSIIDNDCLSIRVTRDGRIIRWPKNVITYEINRSSFDRFNKNWSDSVLKYIREAAKEWENCCNIKFIYVSNEDKDVHVKADFIIESLLMNKYASAFNPDERNINMRKLFIDSSFFNSCNSKVGMLRHELGHILGFPHEENQNFANLKNFTGVKKLSESFDEGSVMIPYEKCPNKNCCFSLELSEMDLRTAKIAYPY